MKFIIILSLLMAVHVHGTSMRIDVLNNQDKPAAGYPFSLFEVEVFEGEEMIIQPFRIDHLDAQGGLTVKDLKAGQKYQLVVGGEETPQFKFSDGETLQLQLKTIVVHDKIPGTIPYFDITNQKSLTFADLQGPLVYVEYWAVW
jgi:hypothetical protein